ncbi:MAG: hypothetical protein G01um101417_44 [Parcubacteria group bacterium Gr01-1014_17]|nr:MAG: hypothetical protein G01um101417_44 [Parcubacteria group bacterium Gr01-1014_17]
MNFVVFLPQYILWHYSAALVDLARAVSNLFWFLWHFFSIELLARSFFVPWKRLGEAQGSFVGRMIVGAAMRAIGIVARLALFALAAFAFAAAFLAALVVLLLWLVLPFVIVFLIIIGVRAL